MPRVNFAAAGACLFALLVVPLVNAVPAPPDLPALSLSPATRVAEYADIPAVYSSVYKVVSRCPNTIRFGEPIIDARQVALLEMSNIQEDAQVCTGPFPMAILAEANLERPGQLEALNLKGFRDALDVNKNAANLVTSSNTSMMVGWHAGERQCGTKVYTPSSIYFIIKEEKPYRISLNKPGQVDMLTIPPLMRSLLIVAPNDIICLLVDRTTAIGSNPELRTTYPNGTSTSAVLTPGGPIVPSATTSAPAPTEEPEISEEPTEPIPSPTPILPSPSSLPLASPSSNPASVAVPDPSDDPNRENAMMSPTAEPETTALPPGSGAIGGDPDATAEPDQSPESVTLPIPSNNDGGSACFPGSAVVTLSSGIEKTMSQLVVGDRVHVGNGKVSDVILFTHRSRSTRHAFLRLATVSGRTLTVSPGHYLYVQEGLLRAAESVRPGDGLVLADEVVDVVESVEHISATGLYNPQTVSGDIIVNGFKTSVYTTAVHPALAHSVLMRPIRWLYSASPSVTRWVASWFDEGSPLFARLLPDGPDGLFACFQ